ncbi:MAG: hypothetical protein JWQ71_1322 [Pedosphaera sp.]|nr:hypothetical protein [Pedosphaera sp.]
MKKNTILSIRSVSPVIFSLRFLFVAMMIFTLCADAGTKPARLEQAPSNEIPTYSIAERGPHHRVWHRVTIQTNHVGKVLYRTNSYTELATGMHFLKDGEWQEASETIKITSEGAFAGNGQHKVNFLANINSLRALQVTTPDAKQLKSHILGLSYWDSSTGQSVLIAELQDSIGQLVAPNQVIYTNAFTDFNVDVRYTYTKAGVEQDIILRQQPPSPSDYGLNPASSRLQVLTEFENPPTPTITTNASPEASDQKLDFGTMKMGRGKAFSIGNPSDSQSSVRIAKQWATLNGRKFLVEEVHYSAITNQLESLPPPPPILTNASILRRTSASDTALHKVSPKRLLPPMLIAKRSTKTMQTAMIDLRNKPGFLLDFDLTGSQTNTIFAANTTYYVSGTVDLYGQTVIEGGTVIKYDNSDTAKLVFHDTNVVCKTGPYRPAIFTAKDDNTFGTTISGSTGTPSGYYGGAAIEVAPETPVLLKNLRFSHFTTALNLGIATYAFSDLQFVHCQQGVSLDGELYLRNALFYDVNTNFYCIPDPCGITCENVTFHQSTRLCTILGYEDYGELGYSGGEPEAAGITLVNSLIVGVTGIGAPSSFTCTTNIASDAGVFQTVGAGSHYLADNSPYRNLGSTNIDADLSARLKQKTTYSPILLTNTITENTTLRPRAKRDTDTPDLGYHYDPLDFISAVKVQNATLDLRDGVALAYFNNNGIWLQENGNVVSQGSPTQRNYLAYYTLVQESATNQLQSLASLSGAMAIVPYHTNLAQKANIDLSFTTISCANGANWTMYVGTGVFGFTNLTIRNCEFYGCGSAFDVEGTSALEVVNLQNNLFHDVLLYSYPMGEFTTGNNLFTGGYVEAFKFGSESWTHKNNVFDAEWVFLDGTLENTAYLNGAETSYQTLQTGDVVTNLTWVTGPLGYFYQATNSPLLNAGSTTADLSGLYHFTTTTNQVKETNSIVDIGFHYVALSNGNPVDSDADGWADYSEDVNGNGVVNSGETDWQDPNDLGLKVIITQPKNNSIIP